MALRVWYNKSFSGTYHSISALAGGDPSIEVVASHTGESAMLEPAHERFLEPKHLVGRAYVDWAIETAKARRIDVFVPGKEAVRVAGAKAELEANGTRVLVAASPEVIAHLHDKLAFYAAFDPSIAPVLEYRAVSTLEEFDAACEELSRGGMICMKPARGVFGHGFRVLVQGEDLDRMLEGDQVRMSMEQARRLLGSRERFPTLLVMRYAGGAERSIDCLGWNGELVAGVVRKKQSGTSVQLLEHNPGALQVAAKIAAAYGLTGIFNVQLKDHGGASYILEINPRASGGLHVAMASGLNYPLWAIRMLLGLARPGDVPAPRTGLRVSQISEAVVIGR